MAKSQETYNKKEKEKKRLQKRQAVSYTHLTLPTNREV